MANQSTYKDGGITWTDHTFIPWKGCNKVSEGCKNCYAEKTIVGRYNLPVWGTPETTKRIRTSETNWNSIVKLNLLCEAQKIKQKVFCNSWGDVFEAHPMLDAWRIDLFRLMEMTTSLIWLVLTKRPENVVKMVPSHWLTQWPKHVVIGTSIENQEVMVPRVSELMKVPCFTRFLSCEPLLGPLNLGLAGIVPKDIRSAYTPVYNLIHWVIVGGESGDSSGKYTARPCDSTWILNVVNECRFFEVPVFVKQLGDLPVSNGVERPRTSYKGKSLEHFPKNIQFQQFPDFDSRL